VPLYELVLRFGDRDEVRLGEGNGYERDEEVVIENRRFVVVGIESPRAAATSRRFILAPAEVGAGLDGERG
jgi:hypothetical protein